LDDSRIKTKGVKVRCSRCNHIFYVVPPPETKEEIIEDVESFAKYHEELIGPDEKKVGPSLEVKAEEKKVALQEDVREKEEAEEKEKEEEEEEKKLEDEEEVEVEEKEVEVKKEKEEEEAFTFPEKFLKEKEEELPRTEPIIEERVEVKPSPRQKVVSREKRGFPRFLPLLIILAILVFGVFYLWSELGPGGWISPFIENPKNKVIKLWNEIWGVEKGGLVIGDINGFEERIGEVPYFIIEGKIKNQSQFTKRYIKIKVIIFDQDKLKVAEREAICGRIIDRGELKKQPIDFFQEEMVIKPQTTEEMVTPSDKAAPFMVIFKDLPSQAKEFKVEILEAPNL
jgi:hypothetical protein